MRAGLDDEGVTFSFDVPALLLAECRRRGQTVPELPDYLDTALLRTDPWGTKMRGYERFSVRALFARRCRWSVRLVGGCLDPFSAVRGLRGGGPAMDWCKWECELTRGIGWKPCTSTT